MFSKKQNLKSPIFRPSGSLLPVAAPGEPPAPGPADPAPRQSPRHSLINLPSVETSRIVTASLLAVSLIPLASPQPRPQPQKVFVGRYCAGCHNEKSPAGGLALSRFANEDMAAHPEVWEKVVRRLRARSMPPAGLPRPDETGYSAIVSSLEASSTATQPPTRIRGAPTPSAA